MEAPGFISLLVTMTAVQKSEGIESLPNANWLMAILYVGLPPLTLSASNDCFI